MNEWLDEDGYPTTQATDAIQLWAKSHKELMKFVKSIWAYADMGYWREESYIDELNKAYVTKYHLSTAGWSGNEDIIHALKQNMIFWSLCWMQSRRGGHYIFELREIE